MGRVVISCYRPKPGREEDLLALLRTHLPTLRSEGLATERDSVVMRAADGTFLEVFEWASSEAIEAAHSNAAVNAMWLRFAEVCDFVPVGSLAEAGGPFSEFAPVDL